MTREDQIRKEILFQLYAVRPIALSAGRIGRDAARERYDFTPVEVRREAEFLADEGLIARVDEPGTTGRLYRIHAAGVRHYERAISS
ncbi:MAG: hypothetical protein KGJ88_01875 [Verrucomicrobiota bacterium]|nr:hypothetical protein [Verrucomicrobiota bacterium]